MKWNKLSQSKRNAIKEESKHIFQVHGATPHHISKKDVGGHNQAINIIMLNLDEHNTLHKIKKDNSLDLRFQIKKLVYNAYEPFFTKEVNPITQVNFTEDQINKYLNFCIVDNYGAEDKEINQKKFLDDDIRAFYDWFEKENKNGIL